MKIRPGYTFDAQTDDELQIYRGGKLICRCQGFFLHPQKKRLWFIDQVYWEDTTSDREKLETGVWLTRQGVMLWWATRKHDYEYYKRVAKHGNLRKIGVTRNLFNDDSAMLWETVI